MAAKNKSNELKITRLYDAPVKAVWEAWVDPKQAAQWWGPRGFTITTHSKDLKVGGTWKYTMHGPDGTDYPNLTTYHEVEKYARLVYDHGATETTPPLFRVTVDFKETNGKTKMDMTMTVDTPEALANIKNIIKTASGNSTWDRLAEYLEKDSSGKERFVINRTFEAPIATLFEMWTSPKHFSQWLPPKGFRMEFIRADIKTGGSSFYFMTNDQGVEMYGRAEYKEVKSPDSLIYVQQFCDKNEKVSRHPMAPTWPELMLTHVKLSEEGPNDTRVTIVWEPQGNVTAEELAAFIKEKAGMTQGWTGSFDKLEELLSKS